MEPNKTIVTVGLAGAILCGLALTYGFGGPLLGSVPTRNACETLYPQGLAVSDLADRSPDGVVAGVNFRGHSDEEVKLAANFNNSLNSSKDRLREMQQEAAVNLPPEYQRYMQNHWAQEDVKRYAMMGAEPFQLPARHLTLREKRELCIGAAAFAEHEQFLEGRMAAFREGQAWTQ